MTEQDPTAPPRKAGNAPPEATEFRLLLEESARLAAEESIDQTDLEEMDAINRMRIVAEAISNEQYIFHSGT